MRESFFCKKAKTDVVGKYLREELSVWGRVKRIVFPFQSTLRLTRPSKPVLSPFKSSQDHLSYIRKISFLPSPFPLINLEIIKEMRRPTYWMKIYFRIGLLSLYWSIVLDLREFTNHKTIKDILRIKHWIQIGNWKIDII